MIISSSYPSDEKISEISCNVVFITSGHKVNTEIFRYKVKIDDGFIERISQTNIEAIFVDGLVLHDKLFT